MNSEKCAVLLLILGAYWSLVCAGKNTSRVVKSKNKVGTSWSRDADVGDTAYDSSLNHELGAAAAVLHHHHHHHQSQESYGVPDTNNYVLPSYGTPDNSYGLQGGNYVPETLYATHTGANLLPDTSYTSNNKGAQASFEASQPSFGSSHSQPSFGTSQPSFGASQPSLGTSQPSYGAPQPSYEVPQPLYGVPQHTYGEQQPSYGPPQQSYGPPEVSYSPSQDSYGPPKTSYGPEPYVPYGPPSQKGPKGGYGGGEQAFTYHFKTVPIKGVKGEGWKHDVKGQGWNHDVKGKGWNNNMKGEGWNHDVKGEGWNHDVKGEGWNHDVKGEGWNHDVKGEGWNHDVKGEGWNHDVKGEGWSTTGGDDYDYEGDKGGGGKGGGSGLGGLGGLGGLAGLVGLKGLLPFLPILALLPLLLLVGALFIPLPFFYFPPGTLDPANGVLKLGRDSSSKLNFDSARFLKSLGEAEKFVSSAYKKVTTGKDTGNNECLQRISCELYQFSRIYNADKFVDAALRKVLQYKSEPIKVSTEDASNGCQVFTCKPFFKKDQV